MTDARPTDDQDPAATDLAARLEQLETRVSELHRRVFALRAVVVALLVLYAGVIFAVAFSPSR